MRYLAQRFGPVSLVLFLFSLPLCAQNQPGKVEVTNEIKHDTSPRLDEIQEIQETGPKKERVNERIHRGESPTTLTDPVLQSAPGPVVATTTGISFDGVGVGLGSFLPNSAPPDTNGAVGATQYVQWVNTSFAVFDKSTGALQYGPAAGNTLWSGFGGPCQINNDGDPVAQYDKAANRWVMTQLSITGAPPYYQCVAVSKTSDARGAYNRYAFLMPDFPDYGKMSVWPDGYYLSFNMFAGGVTFSGARACALDRNAMIAGVAATQQCFNLLPIYGAVLPSDLDGTIAPPTGSPNFFLGYASTLDSLNIFRFHVDWGIPANSTFSGPIILPVAPFGEACGGATCIPQLGTTDLLDSLGDRPMYRLAYRNFGDHDALVVNHSVTAGSSVGVRWYEVRNSGGVPTVYQQGTYAPDLNYRWMGSIAMDKAGDIAVGYSVSNSLMNPSISYTGRAPTDTLGILQVETPIIVGTGSQFPGLSRWGDYSSMSVDPVDDCTFWYTTEYLKTDGTFNWSTRIASFKFPSCGGAPTVPPAPTGLTATAGNMQVSLSWGASSGATSYNVKRSTLSGGPYTTIATGVTTTSYTNTGLVNGTTYYYVVSAVNAVGESPNSNQASATPSAGPAIPPAPAGLTATAGNSQVVLSWGASSGATGYNVKRSTLSGGPYTTIATGVTTTSYTNTGLVNGTTYYYVVSAVNATGESPNSNQASATPQAPPPPPPCADGNCQN